MTDQPNAQTIRLRMALTRAGYPEAARTVEERIGEYRPHEIEGRIAQLERKAR